MMQSTSHTVPQEMCRARPQHKIIIILIIDIVIMMYRHPLTCLHALLDMLSGEEVSVIDRDVVLSRWYLMHQGETVSDGDG